ncbi:MAG: diguanylate cyclase [Blastocatellia bacterium]
MAVNASSKEGSTERLFIWSVSVIGISVFGWALFALISNPIEAERQWLLLSLVTLLVVSPLDVQIPKVSGTITISDTFIFASLLLYGVVPTVVLAGVDAAVCSLHYKNRRKVIPFNAAVMSLSIFVSGTVAQYLFGNLGGLAASVSRLFMAAGLIALLHFILSAGLVGVVNALRSTGDRFRAWREYVTWCWISYCAGAVAACLVVKLVTVISFYAFIVAVPVLACTYLFYKSYLDRVESSVEHAEQMAQLHLRTIEALAIAIDAKDEVAHDHVRRVQIYATGLARLFGLSEQEIEALKAGALLHDIGKLAVPDYILNKPGALTDAEFDRMKVHTIVGAEILERVGFPYPVVPVVRHHHERWDGRGYPDGLMGDQIPITARILTVSDCFDSLREDRHYRKAKTREQALALLREEAGKVFDPEVVRVFLEHLAEFESEIRWQQVDLQPAEPRHPSAPQLPLRSSDTVKTPFERIRSAHREVITLYDIAQTIVTSLDLRDTFVVLASRLQDIVSHTTCVLYLMRENGTEIEAAHVSGRNAETLKTKRVPLGAGIAGWVVANRQAMCNSDPRLDFDAMKVELAERYKAATVVPLFKDGEVLGALGVYSADLDVYLPDHLRLVEAVAKLASDAIGNAVHHEQTEARALTDMITSLPNARALRHRFEEESDRARRHRDVFSVVMMDLDGFKCVNDQLGHQAGDVLLMDLGKLLSSQIRSSDFISRYAGDEFVALLQVGPDEAAELVQRMQRSVDRHAFNINGSHVFIGISAGWASYGSDADTLDQLLLLADRAMYGDKGRRKAVLAGRRDEKRPGDTYRIM